MMRLPTLDIDLLRSFVAVADRAGFTAAGSALGASQSAVSVRIRKLEERVGHELLERSPRLVRLTPLGRELLADARRILDVHDAAVARACARESGRTFELAVSDHAAGALLPAILADVHRQRPDVQLIVTVGASGDLADRYRDGAFDAVVTRREERGRGGRPLHRGPLVWFAAADVVWRPDRPLPLVSLAAPCDMRALATTALAAAGITWRDAFTGTGVAAVQAAAAAGLGVACLSAWNVPAGCRRLGPRDGLPALPASRLTLRHRGPTAGRADVVEAIAEAFRAALRSATMTLPAHPQPQAPEVANAG